MANAWRDLSPGKDVPKSFNVVIEIPKGSVNKYELDKDSGMIKLDRVLYSPFHFIFDYGFVPQSYWEDDDPLDVMVLVTQPTVPGCIIEVRPIGIMEMIDSGDKDHKILAVPVKDPRYDHKKELKDVGEHLLKEIAHFFEHYKDLQNKKVEVLGWKGREEAERAILKSLKMYKEKFGK